MSKKSVLGGILMGVAGAAVTVFSYWSGRNSKKVDDNDAAAEDYIELIETTDDDTDTDEEDSDE